MKNWAKIYPNIKIFVLHITKINIIFIIFHVFDRNKNDPFLSYLLRSKSCQNFNNHQKIGFPVMEVGIETGKINK